MLIIKEVRFYQTKSGVEPYSQWLETLDEVVSARINTHIDRLVLGNLGDWRRVDAGLFEIRVHFGAGYRVYFGLDKERIIVLLCGGDKATQRKDIGKAETYLNDYKKRFAWKTLKN